MHSYEADKLPTNYQIKSSSTQVSPTATSELDLRREFKLRNDDTSLLKTKKGSCIPCGERGWFWILCCW